MSVKRNIAIYCRVSTDDQAENGYNLREQEKRINQYIQAYAEDFPEDVITYIDDGYSAKNLNRREMLLLINDVKNGLISKVLVHNLDRLTRSMKDFIVLLEMFEEYDVQLFSLKEKIDTTSAIGRLFINVIVLMAQWERETISERTIRALDEAAEEGVYISGKPPFGYDAVDKRLVVNEKQAIIVKQIYYMYFYEELSINAIYHHLKSNYAHFEYPWTYDRVSNILKNEIYTGTFKNKRLVIENHSPAIISHDLFNDTQNMLLQRNRRDKMRYVFRNVCYDSATGDKLISDCSKKSSKTYLYQLNTQTKQRINEVQIDEQIRTHFDHYFQDVILLQFRSQIETLKRRDSHIRALEYLVTASVISKEYYITAVNNLIDGNTLRESQLVDVLNQVRTWSVLSPSEKTMAVKTSIKRIDIDLVNKKITAVVFK